MATSINALRLRAIFGRDAWLVPTPFGADGWRMVAKDRTSSVIVTCFDWDDGLEYVHASIAHNNSVPTYEDLVLLHTAVWGKGGYAYQMFVPRASHVNIHEHALHLWGRRDGKAILPDFGAVLGSI